MRQYFDVNRLHRDTLNSKVSGVCAGLAKHWEQPRWLIRVAALVCLVLFPVATGIAYIMAVLLLPTR